MRIRHTNEPGIRRLPCPFCGLAVVCDDGARTVHHETAPCASFAAKVREFGLQTVRAEPTLWIDDRAIDEGR